MGERKVLFTIVIPTEQVLDIDQRNLLQFNLGDAIGTVRDQLIIVAWNKSPGSFRFDNLGKVDIEIGFEKEGCRVSFLERPEEAPVGDTVFDFVTVV